MWGLNESIEQVQKLPFSLVEWIYMDRVGLILTYLIVISLISGLQFHSFKTLIFSTILSLGFIGHNIRTHREQVLEEKLIFYEIKDRTAIDYIRGESAHLFIDEIPSNLELLEFQIDPNRLANHLPPISQSIFPIGEIIEKGSMSYGQIAEKRILIFDSTTFHLRFTDRIKTDILLIENESVKSLKWLSKNFQFDHLVIGNKNSHSYSRRLKKQAMELNIELHSLKSDGALTIELNGHKKRADKLPALFTTNPD